MEYHDREQEKCVSIHSAQISSRRAFLGSLVAATAATATVAVPIAVEAAAGGDGDAELIRLAAEFDRLMVDYPAIYFMENEAADTERRLRRQRAEELGIHHAEVEDVPERHSPRYAWIDNHIAAADGHFSKVERVCDEIRKHVPTTSAGVAAAIRAARWAVNCRSFLPGYQVDDACEEQVLQFFATLQLAADRALPNAG
jgi:hypothetical protein